MRFLSINEAAQLLGLSTSTLYKKTSARSIPFFKIGGRVLFEEEMLEQWIRNHAVQPIGFTQDFFSTEEGNDAA